MSMSQFKFLVWVSALLSFPASCGVHPRGWHRTAQVAGPCHPHGRPRLSSQVLALAWASPGRCRCLRSELENGEGSLCLTNKYFKNIFPWTKEYTKPPNKAISIILQDKWLSKLAFPLRMVPIPGDFKLLCSQRNRVEINDKFRACPRY